MLDEGAHPLDVHCPVSLRIRGPARDRAGELAAALPGEVGRPQAALSECAVVKVVVGLPVPLEELTDWVPSGTWLATYGMTLSQMLLLADLRGVTCRMVPTLL